MKKIKYYYNTNTLRYEKLETPLRVTLLRVLGFLASCIVASVIIVSIAFKYLKAPEEKRLQNKFNVLTDNLEVLRDQTLKLEQQVADLEKRDNNVYRAIFEANPIPDSARTKAMEKQKEMLLVSGMAQDDLSGSIINTLNTINNRIAHQNKSYDEIAGFIKDKANLLACTPAIQPVSNKDLSRIASGFGHRIDPVYKTVKMHEGLDFAAPQGTPIYATANGTIAVSGNTANGYGNHVVINHGYGYETLYGHMVRVKVHAGEKVKRGEIIGWVGSTGKSTGPHCHYEVHKNGQKVDPVYFFYNDLSPEQYDRLLKLAGSSNQSFD